MAEQRPERDVDDRKIPWDWIFDYPTTNLQILRADDRYFIAYPKGFAEHNSIVRGDVISGNRLEVGDYLKMLYPSKGHDLPSQMFIDAITPLDFGGDPEDLAVQQLWERVDMAVAVMGVGGACTSCGAEPRNKEVTHRRGCEVLSAMLWKAMQIEDEEPTLEQVIQQAKDQIDRMN
jgi:hypothetical protein